MKSFALASIALASVAFAQLEALPPCALPCLIGPLTSDGCPSITDFACHCKKGASLLSAIEPCLKGACPPAEQASVLSGIQSTCAGAGVEIGGGAVGPAAVAPSAEAYAPAPSVAASVLSSALSVASSEASVASSLASQIAHTAAPSASVTYHMPAAPSPFTGGAPQATKAAGFLGAAALAMLAL